MTKYQDIAMMLEANAITNTVDAYEKGRADGYSQAEKDYYKQTEKDRKSSYDCGYEQGKADAIEELKTDLIDIIFGNEEFIDWQKQEIILCLECAIENLKEQK